MGSSGVLQRPLFAAAAVAVASVSTDLQNKFTPPISTDDFVTSEASNSHFHDSTLCSDSSWVSHISVSKLAKLSFVTEIQVPLPNINYRPLSLSTLNFAGSSTFSSPVLINLYQSAHLSRASKPKTYLYTSPNLPSEDLYRWHLPEPTAINIGEKSDCSSAKSKTVVVLLGWLGAKQKHLSKYAEWYTSRGFHVITFTFPISEVLSYQVGGKAEHDVELLVDHLAEWVEDEHGKNLVFHTFSNTGWLTYGVMLEKFQKHGPSLLGNIRGCIVDSAPVADPDPQVYASGFTAAFLKKQSIATKGFASTQDSVKEGSIITKTVKEPKPAVTETALRVVLEKFFGVVLNLPSVNRRLSDIVAMLSSKQPKCPQLYIYSSADRVIPARYVESFMEQQRRSGLEVRSCDFISTPHVDHFRNDPQLYSTQLTRFFEDCVLSCCKGSV